jgi:hypothetical protein
MAATKNRWAPLDPSFVHQKQKKKKSVPAKKTVSTHRRLTRRQQDRQQWHRRNRRRAEGVAAAAAAAAVTFTKDPIYQNSFTGWCCDHKQDLAQPQASCVAPARSVLTWNNVNAGTTTNTAFIVCVN